MNKSFIRWIQTRNWCELNPGKKAAIVTPYGRFEIIYIVHEKLEEKYESVEFDKIEDE